MPSSSANRTQFGYVVETTPGTTPVTPRMRTARITGESLTYTPTYVDSDELRPDRMLGDPIETIIDSGGSVNFELSYPVDSTFLSDVFRSAFFNTWTNAPAFDNDGTADSVVTDAGTVANTYAVVSGGAAAKAGHLVQATGFTNAANNQVFRVTSSSATTIVGTALSLTAEAAPPGTARLKVVGFQGASGDITALADGIGSTLLDFTTLGLAVGNWVKIGGTLDTSTFAFLVTAGLVSRAGAWARVTAITATKLTLDNLPSGWTTDSGTSKTIKVWFGDQIKNGATQANINQVAMTLEKGFLGQAAPVYVVTRGQTVNTLALTIASRAKITGSAAFMGMSGGESTTALDAAIDAATTNAILAANSNVGRIGEAGATLSGPNFVKQLTISYNNNLRAVDELGNPNPAKIEEGEFTVTGTVDTLFGDDTLLAKFYAGTATAINGRVMKNNQAMIFAFPRVTYRGGGQPQATAKNTDVMLSMNWQSSKDPLTSAHAILDRLEYAEN